MRIETVSVSRLPNPLVSVPERVARAREAFDRGETPPPLLLLRTRKGFDVYDGCGRIVAAREMGVDSLPAVIVDTPTQAVAVRTQLGKYPSIAEAWEALL